MRFEMPMYPCARKAAGKRRCHPENEKYRRIGACPLLEEEAVTGLSFGALSPTWLKAVRLRRSNGGLPITVLSLFIERKRFLLTKHLWPRRDSRHLRHASLLGLRSYIHGRNNRKKAPTFCWSRCCRAERTEARRHATISPSPSTKTVGVHGRL